TVSGTLLAIECGDGVGTDLMDDGSEIGQLAIIWNNDSAHTITISDTTGIFNLAANVALAPGGQLGVFWDGDSWNELFSYVGG
ncbi:MAG: hypothetical protein ABIH46_07855, partial [Chloroflexota bacterium]